ncbi:MAG: DUF4249 domain-containing protein [Prolixibacteraceae bacterium]
MKRKNIFILPLLLTITLFSCEKEIIIDVEANRPKLVINGFVAADSIIEITIGASKTVLDVDTADFVWIDDAIATLYVDNEEKEQLSIYPIKPIDNINYEYYGLPQPTVGYRSTLTKGEVGRTYKLVVTHPRFETATCETTIPVPQKIISISKSTEFLDYSTYSYVRLNLYLTFEDDVDANNYYRITPKIRRGEWKTDSEEDTTGYIIVGEGFDALSSDDPILNPSKTDVNDFLINSPYNRYLIFTDELLSGNTCEVRLHQNFNAYVLRNNQINSKPGEFYSYTIYLNTLSQEAFLYVQSSYMQLWYRDDYFAEPVQVYSNIKNGVGIFAGYSSSQITISDGEYPVDGVEYRYN